MCSGRVRRSAFRLQGLTALAIGVPGPGRAGWQENPGSCGTARPTCGTAPVPGTGARPGKNPGSRGVALVPGTGTGKNPGSLPPAPPGQVQDDVATIPVVTWFVGAGDESMKLVVPPVVAPNTSAAVTATDAVLAFTLMWNTSQSYASATKSPRSCVAGSRTRRYSADILGATSRLNRLSHRPGETGSPRRPSNAVPSRPAPLCCVLTAWSGGLGQLGVRSAGA